MRLEPNDEISQSRSHTVTFRHWRGAWCASFMISFERLDQHLLRAQTRCTRPLTSTEVVLIHEEGRRNEIKKWMNYGFKFGPGMGFCYLFCMGYSLISEQVWDGTFFFLFWRFDDLLIQANFCFILHTWLTLLFAGAR